MESYIRSTFSLSHTASALNVTQSLLTAFSTRLNLSATYTFRCHAYTIFYVATIDANNISCCCCQCCCCCCCCCLCFYLFVYFQSTNSGILFFVVFSVHLALCSLSILVSQTYICSLNACLQNVSFPYKLQLHLSI